MAVTPQQAKAELARRELARRAAAKSQAAPETPTAAPGNAPYEPTMLEEAGQFLQPLAETAGRIQSTIPLAAGAINPALGLAQYAGSKMNEASGMVGENTAESLGAAGVNPYASAGAGMVAGIASNPMTYLTAMGVGKGPINTELAPFKGKPGLTARFNERATGVKASSFERLRRDPGAFFTTASREEAGAAIGEAKGNAGVSLGVTNDIKSLTSKNLQKARNVPAAGAKAQNAVIGRIENVLESGDLDTLPPGAKEGSPHALFAYTDEFGEGGKPRNIYNVFGDKNDPIMQKVGHGSSVQKARLDELGIPITGREPNSVKFNRIANELPMDDLMKAANVTPDEVSTALDGINQKLTKLERTEGRGSQNFQKWSTIKNHFQNMLETVAPEVKAANQKFSRVALRDEFMEAAPVNQSGTMSKIDAFGFTPAVMGAGALLGGGPGAIAAYLSKAAIRSPFVRGLGTAVRGGLDKLVDPGLSVVGNLEAKSGPLVGTATQRPEERLREFARRFVRVQQ